MYIPPDAKTSTAPKEIIALVGAPGCGKSTSALTFPNRIWGDGDHKVPVGEPAIPFWDASWVETMHLRRYQPSDPPNFRDAIRKWHREQLPKFSQEQTFIDDSWTQLISMAGRQIRLDESRLDKANKFYFWGELKKYCEELAGYIKDAPCKIVVSFHETPEWSEGDPTGKMKPVQDGSYKDQLFSIYTDVYRVVNGIRITQKETSGMIKTRVIEGRYWQVQGDAAFDTNANDTLSKLIRKHGIKYVEFWIDPTTNAVLGGYNEISRIYREQDLVVKDGILLRPVT
jgi:hypothetical protein